MFLRATTRKKDGKEHRYYSVVENKRVSGGRVLQRHVLYLGEINTVSGFRLRARLGFSIPSAFSGQRGITPAFGYDAPHPSARGISTLLNNALLSAHYGLC
jgi:hypothetical protein